MSCILPKCAKTREPKDEHCVLWCTCISYNICDPIPLDNLKKHTALPYIIWGLIWDIKNKTERSQLTNFTRLSSRISKIREGISMQTSHTERRKISVAKFIAELASKHRKSESSNSRIGDEW